MAEKTKSLRIQTGIPKAEWEAAAKWFAMSNMAVLQLVPGGIKDIHAAYSHVNGMVTMETGVGMHDEYKEWLKEVRKSVNGDYFTSEWNKQRVNWI